jgi:hypothetical protein
MFVQYLKTFDDIIEKAKKSKHIIRKDFFHIYDVVEKYVKDNNLILSSVETLIKKEKTTFRSYIIFGDNIFRHANNLANIIAKITVYVLMYTNKKNENFSITMNGTSFIQLFNIQNRMRKVIVPVTVGGVLMYPPEFELIELYHKLYLPNYADEWDKLQKLEVDIRKQTYDRRKILGGYHNKHKHKQNQKDKRTFVDNKIILKWLKGRNDYMLVGVNAINILNDSDTYYQKVQILTSCPSEKIVSEFSNLIFQYIGFRVTHKIHNANMSFEPRLQKTVVSVTIPDPKRGKRTIHLMDIFNSPQYELVPYTTYRDLNIGYSNVLRMFMLVDMWFLRILSALNLINERALKQSVDIVFENLSNVDKISLSKYSVELYLGTYVDLMRYKKKQSLQNTFYPYNPEQTRYQKGNFRNIGGG